MRLLALLLVACGAPGQLDAGVDSFEPPRVRYCVNVTECCYPYPTGLRCFECCDPRTP